MDENGEISQAAPGEDKTTAEKHTNSELQDHLFWIYSIHH
jgi:NTP pyrophosphatase (non-canonical NTP hydrolase)